MRSSFEVSTFQSDATRSKNPTASGYAQTLTAWRAALR